MPKNVTAGRPPHPDSEEPCEICASTSKRAADSDQLLLHRARSVRPHAQLMLAAGPPEETKGGDTGGCSICPKLGTIFIDILKGVVLTAEKSRIEVWIDDELEFVATGAALDQLNDARRIVLHLPSNTVGFQFPPRTRRSVFLWLDNTTPTRLKQRKDCTFGGTSP